MKDENGLFYYPFPQNKRVRMYVRQSGGAVEFRLWNADDPALWEKHGWIPYDAIIQARGLYRANAFDPELAYDIGLATALLREGE